MRPDARQRGWALLETMLVVALAVIVVALVLANRMVLGDAVKEEQLVRQAQTVSTLIDRLYPPTALDSSGYAGLNNAMIESIAPSAIKGGTNGQLRDAFGGAIVVSEENGNATFKGMAKIELQGIPSQHCVPLAGRLAQGFDVVMVGGFTIKRKPGVQYPPNTVALVCRFFASGNTFNFTLYKM
jgi:hypothetical protein